MDTMALGDTIFQVGCDLYRRLGPNDRLAAPIHAGQSPERIAFLHQVMSEAPTEGVYPHHSIWNKETYLIKDNAFYLHYYGNSQQAKARLYLPDKTKFKLEIIDAWNMTIEQVDGTFSGMVEISLPGRPYMAVRAEVMK